MRMKKKLLAGFLCSVVIAMGVTPSSAIASNSEEVIRVMANGMATDAYTATMIEMAEEYSAANPYGVTFEFEMYSNDEYKTKLTTLMAANNVPDMFFTWELGYLQPFVESGKVLSIQPYLDEDEEWKNSFKEGVLDYTTYDGECYAIPTQIAYCTMFYNQDMFDEYGISVPQTYDEFCSVCETLKENGVTPMALAGSEAWIPAQFLQQIALGIDGGKSSDAITDGTGVWNNDSFVKAAEECQNMIDNGYFSDGLLAMSYDEAANKLKDGSVAMYFMATWDGDSFTADKEDLVGKISCFNMPGVEEDYSTAVVGSVDTSWALGATCSNPEACVGFLKFMTSTDWQTRDLLNNAKVPSVMLDADSVEGADDIAYRILENMEGTKMYPWWDRVFGSGEGEAFNNACLASFGGDDAQQAFDECQATVEANANL